MRMKLYYALVNRHSGIRSRYHKFHDQGGTVRRLVSYLYLIFLNFCYYCLFCRFLDKEEQMAAYEEKRLPRSPESMLYAGQKLTVTNLVDTLSQYDVVSFDIFDTLIFRPFSEPADLFYFLGDRLGLMDLKRIRMEQEALARRDCFLEQGHCEVTFEEIWKRMEREMGVQAESGMKLEQELEMKFCYANSFMFRVFEELCARGKEIICVSDMYLPRAFLDRLLTENGYTGIRRVYVSCEYGKNKGGGELYETVRADFPEGVTFAHVGDNAQSDVKMAEKHGFKAVHYPNVNRQALSFRPYDMSPIVGGAYRGIVDNRLYQGGNTYSAAYEYGFVYGGLFVLGYCHFIHEYCHCHGVEKLLFLSRDGDVLKRVYDGLYPDDCTAYVYWSRNAAVKLMAEYDRYDYFRRFLYHKVDQGISIGEILDAMGLHKLWETLEHKDPESGDMQPALRLSDRLTNKNVDAVKAFLLNHYEEVCAVYREGQEAARAYYEKQLSGIGHAAAVDIGWAGSGAVSLSYLVERVWKLPCQITGILAGTNTMHNREPEAGEMFLQNGKMVSYLFSQSHNRDVMKKHDPDRDYNVYWELLLSSPEKRFLGFSFKEGVSAGVYGEDGREVRLLFGGRDADQEGILEIRRGILDFVSDYVEHFRGEPALFGISGRDACAPMLAAAGHGEEYLKRIAAPFVLEKGV
ncbi:MAG: hypothetical protein NC331_06775 [Lachnospiraceae bacterium]|nr:hypothetical protein [Lachnospiraceae bacterium]MCM1239074.1 hypothetical protein [Lachnospiraceae bacterium]